MSNGQIEVKDYQSVSFILDIRYLMYEIESH